MTRACLDCGRSFRVPASGSRSRCSDCSSSRDAARNAARTWYQGSWQSTRRRHLAENPWCVVCGATTDLTVDHIVPRMPEFGLQTLCRLHNSSKGNR